MKTWNTLPESYQQWVYKNTLATAKRHIQQAQNPMPAEVSSIRAARVDNLIHPNNSTSEVALEEPEITTSYLYILIDNKCMYDLLHFGIPGGSGDYEDQGDESGDSDAITTTSWQ
jgi:hypothetical protein